MNRRYWLLSIILLAPAAVVGAAAVAPQPAGYGQRAGGA